MNRIIITGGSGYIGSELSYQLIKKKAQVRVLDILPPKFKNKNLEFIYCDLSGYNSKITKYFNNADVCIHLAAKVGGINFANSYPATIMKNNAAIDINVIQAVSESKIQKFLYASSSLVYEKSKKIPYVENDLGIAPDLCYGFGKLFGERLCLAYANEQNFKFTVCRLFNAYGVNSLGFSDPHGHVITDLIKKIYSGQSPLVIIGDGKQSRSFSHVKDLASGIIKVMECNKLLFETVNIASGDEYTVNDIVKKLWKLLKKTEKLTIRHTKTTLKDVRRSVADITKIKSTTGWIPKVLLDDGLLEVIDKYERNHVSK